jgi:growth factor-regulated tyrosine kinase substrate
LFSTALPLHRPCLLATADALPQLTDICIKNGGDHFLAEVASREFMDNLVSILKAPSGVNHEVKAKALGLIQNWAQLAEARPGSSMSYISETYRSLKSSGFDFPPRDPSAVISAALVETMTAPEWVDSDVCMRCRTAFTTFNRKHHCRNCGHPFCQQCSSHTMSLPWFGVGQDVRVCDGCHAKRAPPKKSVSSTSSGSTKLNRSRSDAHVTPSGRGGAAHQRSNTLGSKPAARSAGSGTRRQREEDDLALAIKLSLEGSGGAGASSSGPGASGYVPSQPPTARATRQADGRMMEGTDADDDPDLAAAIAASLRDYAPPAPSAPEGLPGPDEQSSTPRPHDGGARGSGRQPQQMAVSTPALSIEGQPLMFSHQVPPSLELPAQDVDALLSFAQAVASHENYARQHGAYPAAHPGPEQQQTQALLERASAARPRMARNLEEGNRRHGVLVSMHDKLTEAVRLYDRILDAQLSRPPGAYGQQYGAPPQQFQGAYGHQQHFAGPPGHAEPSPAPGHQQHGQYYAAPPQPGYMAQGQEGYGYGGHSGPSQPPQRAGSVSYAAAPGAPPSHYPASPTSEFAPSHALAPPQHYAPGAHQGQAPQQQYQQYAPPSPVMSMAATPTPTADGRTSYMQQPQQPQAPGYGGPQGAFAAPQAQQPYQAPQQQGYPGAHGYGAPEAHAYANGPSAPQASAPPPSHEQQQWQSLQSLPPAPHGTAPAMSPGAGVPAHHNPLESPVGDMWNTAQSPPAHYGAAPSASLDGTAAAFGAMNLQGASAPQEHPAHASPLSPVRPPSVGSTVSTSNMSAWRDIPIAPTHPPSEPVKQQESWQRPMEASLIDL